MVRVVFLAAMPLACVDMFAQLAARFDPWVTAPTWRTRGLLLERGVPPDRACLLSQLPGAPRGRPASQPVEAWEHSFRAFLSQTGAERLVVFNHYRPQYRAGAVRAARSLSIPAVFAERGPLASHYYFDPVGVGPEGVPQLAHVWESLLAREADAGSLQEALARWKEIEAEEVEPQPNRRAAGGLREELGLAAGDRLAFFPFQVEDDIQITHFSPWIRSMEQAMGILEAAAAETGWRVLAKPHPRAHVQRSETMKEAVVIKDVHLEDAIQACDTVVTLNSSVGLRGLVMGKPVIALGKAIYSGKGLTLDVTSTRELARALDQSRTWQSSMERVARLVAFLLDDYLVRHPLADDEHRAVSVIGEPELAAERMTGSVPWPQPDGPREVSIPAGGAQTIHLLVAARASTVEDAVRLLKERTPGVEIAIEELPRSWVRVAERGWRGRAALGGALLRRLACSPHTDAVIAVVDDTLLAPRAVRWALMGRRAAERWWWCPRAKPIRVTWGSLWEREVGDWLPRSRRAWYASR